MQNYGLKNKNLELVANNCLATQQIRSSTAQHADAFPSPLLNSAILFKKERTYGNGCALTKRMLQFWPQKRIQCNENSYQMHKHNDKTFIIDSTH